MSPQGLTRWSADFTETLPNVAESWTVSADSTSYTFKLRDGMKWSDGAPFTADDVLFFVNDLLNNEEFYGGSPPARYVIKGEPMQAEKVDDTTVILSFAGPYGQFLQELATPLGQEPVLWAKHYCQQFHPDYNDNVSAMVEDEGAADWVDLFQRKCGMLEIPARWGNPERPTLDPWIVTEEAYTGDATRVVLARNPYFWQVDTAGNQLPYIDTLRFGVEQDPESLVLQVIAGEIDMQSRHLDAAKNVPVFYENQEAGGYDFFKLLNSSSNAMAFYMNFNHKDPVKQALFTNKDFRVALSLGMDREELIDLIYLGQGEPWQIGAKKLHPLYDERLSKQYTEYDTDRANEILDSIGLTERDADGFRLMSNGERVSFQVDVIPTLSPEWADAMELINRYWADLGIASRTNSLERSIYYARGDSNDFDVQVWSAPGGYDPTLSPRNVMAVHPEGSRHALQWATWYTSGGASGVEPSASMLKRYDLFAEYKANADPAEQMRLFREIHDIAADEFEVFGVVSDPDRIGIKNAKLRNVPEQMVRSWMYPNPGPTLPQQYYYAE
jgi:peptide/nickel transport system substrate-binding protein